MSGRIIPFCSRILIEFLTKFRKKSTVFFGTIRTPIICGSKQIEINCVHRLHPFHDISETHYILYPNLHIYPTDPTDLNEDL
jgi:hypothetical protein